MMVDGVDYSWIGFDELTNLTPEQEKALYDLAEKDRVNWVVDKIIGSTVYSHHTKDGVVAYQTNMSEEYIAKAIETHNLTELKPGYYVKSK